MRIYCDHNATTPLRPEALEAMLPFFRGRYGNASSSHALGSAARCAVEEARGHVAALIGGEPAEIVFTSGGTESNNLAISGAARGPATTLIVTPMLEHSSVRESVAERAAEGCVVRHVPVDASGLVSAADVGRILDDQRPPGGFAMTSVGWANNEVGTVQPIEAIARECRARNVLVHVDAVQAVGKIPVSAHAVDLLSMSAHKIGGPQGVGALFIRRGIEVRPLLRGGGQERNRRAGTENVAGIVGFGEACRLAAAELGAFAEAMVALRERLWEGLQARLPGLFRNSPIGEMCLPNTLNVSFAGVRGEALVAALDLEGVAVSSGSACAAGAGEPSHVLLAMGRDVDAARDGVRFSLGRTNTMEEVEHLVAMIAAVVRRVRGVGATRGCHA